MNEYMLIFRHEDGARIASPEQMEIWMQQTRDWIAWIAERHAFVEANGLPFDGARVIRTRNGRPEVSEGPFGGVQETLGGYIIVKTDSLDEAVAVAKRCPVLQGEGNSVEIRKIARPGGGG